MNIVGIIAEYNPYHNGHLYQMERAREVTGADFVVVVMSGDFVQRGAPAIYDKYLRTRMALEAGADLVLELPSAFATGSAEEFAACGVALLHRLGCVDSLCFGSECGDIAALTDAATDSSEETDRFRIALQGYLRKGYTYPAARDAARQSLSDAADDSPEAARQSLSDTADDSPEAASQSLSGIADDGPAAARLPSSPNDILGSAYIKALRRLNSPIVPVAIRREGNQYHDGRLSGSLSSATALRGRILDDQRAGTRPETDAAVAEAVPPCVSRLLPLGTPMAADDFSLLLNERLLSLHQSNTPFQTFADVSEDLDARIRRQLLSFDDFESRIQSLKTRQYTYTRISRSLTHILLGITKEQVAEYKDAGYARYARILGLRPRASGLMKQIKNQGEIPLVSKVADAKDRLSPAAWQMLRQDLYCSHIYQAAVWNRCRKALPNEYTRSVILV